MTVADADTAADVADRLLRAIESGDRQAIAQLWHDDVVVWKVGDRERDKERALRVLEWFIDTTTHRRYEVIDRRFFEGGYVQQHILHATGRNGGSIAMRVCLVVQLGTDGLINRVDEYFDPVDIAPLFAATEGD